jgi:hypothetical protein
MLKHLCPRTTDLNLSQFKKIYHAFDLFPQPLNIATLQSNFKTYAQANP